MHSKSFRLNKIGAGLLLMAAGTTAQAIKPSDPLYESTFYIGPSYFQWGLQALNLEAAWDLTRGHAYLGISDSGIDIDHPDLVGNFRPQFSYDFGSCPSDNIVRVNGFPTVFRCIDDPTQGANSAFHELGDGNVDEIAADDTSYYSGGRPVAGHGTHVAGIMAATSNNNTGTAGVCWDCSIMMTKMRGFRSTGLDSSTTLDIKANALIWLIENGAQVINRSGADAIDLVDNGITCDSIPNNYRTDVINPQNFNNRISYEKAVIKYCDALATLEERDIVMVAAAGNEGVNDIHFPASDPRVISVGAVDIWGSATPIAGSVATNVPANIYYTEVQLNFGPEQDFVGPGFNVLSTFYYSPTDIYNDGQTYVNGAVWNDGGTIYRPECADYKSVIKGYGPCSGTSMGAPHIAGIAGLMRSVNPLLKKDQIKQALVKYASRTNARDDIYGYGVPDAFASVKEVLGKSDGQQLVNRLTPLFSLISSSAQDSFYTTSPQMAMAAMYGAMQPQPSAGTVQWYSSGASVPGYPSFPKPGFWWTDNPRANVYLMTTYRNPFIEGAELRPLYRLSRQRVHGSNNRNVDHTYAINQSQVNAYVANGYRLDGTEGYIFPYQETGTVRLYRKYNPTRDDHAIFPASQLSYMTSRGYTQNLTLLGYVYPNRDSDGDGLVDGFELVAGTSISDRDSDGDGVTDGDEINKYPYGDPLDNPLVP